MRLLHSAMARFVLYCVFLLMVPALLAAADDVHCKGSGDEVRIGAVQVGAPAESLRIWRPGPHRYGSLVRSLVR